VSRRSPLAWASAWALAGRSRLPSRLGGRCRVASTGLACSGSVSPPAWASARALALLARRRPSSVDTVSSYVNRFPSPHFVFLHFVAPTCSQLVFSPPPGGMRFFSVSRCLPLALFLIAARVLTPRGFPAHPPWIGRHSSSYACRLSILWGRLFVPCLCVGILPTFPILLMLLWLY
jgi:hypothetical protein